MAIQNRRGAYADFDPTKMVPGEYAIVLSDDPNDQDGHAVYMCFGSGEVKRLALTDNVQEIVEDLYDSLIQVSDSQPTDPENKIWVKETPVEVQVPSLDEFDDLLEQLNATISASGTSVYGFLTNLAPNIPQVTGSQVIKVTWTSHGSGTLVMNDSRCFVLSMGDDMYFGLINSTYTGLITLKQVTATVITQ